MTDRLTERLKKEGYQAECIHGDVKQSQRNVVMNDFRRGKFPILIATDVAARGIDVVTWKQSSILICQPKTSITCTVSVDRARAQSTA